jgi:flavin-dependent dehydrogenase
MALPSDGPPKRFGFKAHLSGVEGLEDRIELFFYPSGYGGLVKIENGLANLCFITSHEIARRQGSSPERLLQETVLKNPLARQRLTGAKLEQKWIGAGPLSFGQRRFNFPGLLSIGDAAGEIDPFLGEGMMIALQSAELAAEAIDGAIQQEDPVGSLPEIYEALYRATFKHRFKLSGLLRRAAFSPFFGNQVIRFLANHNGIATAVARATRQ